MHLFRKLSISSYFWNVVFITMFIWDIFVTPPQLFIDCYQHYMFFWWAITQDFHGKTQGPTLCFPRKSFFLKFILFVFSQNLVIITTTKKITAEGRLFFLHTWMNFFICILSVNVLFKFIPILLKPISILWTYIHNFFITKTVITNQYI